jgi:hypothetical protein
MRGPGIGGAPILRAELQLHAVCQGDIPPVCIVGQDDGIVRLVLGSRHRPRHDGVCSIGADDQGRLLQDRRARLSLPANTQAASTRSLSRTVRRGAYDVRIPSRGVGVGRHQ